LLELLRADYAAIHADSSPARSARKPVSARCPSTAYQLWVRGRRGFTCSRSDPTENCAGMLQ
jgi:hypothetical protein